MEDLISFVTHNFYFVIVIVGIIYSLFFRKSPLERSPNRMPDFGGGQRPPRQREEDEPVETLPSEPELLEVRFPEPQRQAPPPAAPVKQERSDSKMQQAPNVQGLGRDNLTQAVLWAEILGPPRARRPYRR